MVPTLCRTLGVKGHRPVVGTWDNKHQLYVFASVNVKQVSTGIFDDEIHDRLRVFWRKRKMSFARPDDNRDLSAKLLITFLNDASVAVQPGIQGAAVVQDRHACFPNAARLSIGCSLPAMRLCMSGFRA